MCESPGSAGSWEPGKLHIVSLWRRPDASRQSHFDEGISVGAELCVAQPVPLVVTGARRWEQESIQRSVCVPHWAPDRLPAAGTALPSTSTGGSRLSSLLSAQHLLPLTACPRSLSSLAAITSPQRVQQAAYLQGSSVLPRAPLLWPGPARRPSWGLPTHQLPCPLYMACSMEKEP